MSKRSKKEALILLRAIEFEKAPLSKNKGRIIHQKYPRPSKKDRRHDGRYFPRIMKPQTKYSFIYENCLESCEYDEWRSYRDGFRDWRNIHKNVYYNISFYDDELYYNMLGRNRKIRKKEKIRKAMKIMDKIRRGEITSD